MSSQEAVKQCCARLYESDFAKILLGDSFHPGGLRLTERLGTLLGLTAQSRLPRFEKGYRRRERCRARETARRALSGARRDAMTRAAIAPARRFGNAVAVL